MTSHSDIHIQVNVYLNLQSYFRVPALNSLLERKWSLSESTFVIFLVLFLFFFHRQMSRNQCQRLDGADLYNPEYPDELEFVYKLLTTGNLIKNQI